MKKREKPKAATVVRKGTLRNLAYLAADDLILGDFAPDIVLPNYTYPVRCPMTGAFLRNDPITNGEPTHGV